MARQLGWVVRYEEVCMQKPCDEASLSSTRIDLVRQSSRYGSASGCALRAPIALVSTCERL